ncbi:hypothetical protein LCGC14_0558040 [marine sediment metagenome]|uniref:UTP23 sensor motif region domain-containing protein n=1 Tax=marine sediment metagenome TaxID=412755 RepID=A0A0F9U9E4_9ZZZZ
MNIAVLDNARQILRRVRESGAPLVKAGKLAVAGQLPQYDTVPHSSLTFVSDFAANKRFGPKEPNPLTREERRRLEQLLAGMSKSRARIVDARRRARISTSRLRQLFTASGLWG